MDTKSDEQFLAIKATIETNKKEADNNQLKNDEKMTILTENLQKLTTFMMDQTNIYKSSPSQKDTSTNPDPTTVVQTNRRALTLEGGHSTNIGGMRSAHQNSMSSLSRQNSKETLLWISRIYFTTSRCISMR